MGTSVGFPGLYPILKNASIYSYLCDHISVINCSNMIDMELELIGSTTLTTINAAAILQGVVTDIFGTRIAGIIGVILWIIFTLCSGFDPEKGWIFFIRYGFIIECHYW